MRSELRACLAQFDGKATSILGEAEARFRDAPDYLDALIAMIDAPEDAISDGSTWLIKSALERRVQLSPAQAAMLLDRAANATRWAAQLHLCQCVQYLAIPASHTGRLATLILPCLTHDRPFVRAWSLDAMGHLATQHSGFQSAFDEALAQAQTDPAASVRARARKWVP